MRLRARCGLTLAEVVVALVLLQCGALALVAASAAAVRVVAAAEAQERATLAARDRLEQLALRACSTTQLETSADSSPGLRERWAVSPVRGGVRLAVDTVEYFDRDMTRALVLERLVLC